MKKTLWNNGVFLSLLTAGIVAVAGFWLSTYRELGVQQAKIVALEKQVERLTEAVTELWREAWSN